MIAVVMGGQTAAARDQHMAQLLDRSFNQGAHDPAVGQQYQ